MPSDVACRSVVGWDQRRFAAPVHHRMNNVINDNEHGGPALEASLSHPTEFCLDGDAPLNCSCKLVTITGESICCCLQKSHEVAT